MLKHLFTSKARVKLLTVFLLNPDEEYFVRELTRDLDEQINSVRRELDNLKKMGLLKARNKNRKRFYSVNKKFLLFRELKSIIVKGTQSMDPLVKEIAQMGEIDFLLISGSFLKKESPVDLLVVGEVDKDKLESFLDRMESKEPIRFSILSTKDFLYRLECRDHFILDLINDEENIIAIDTKDSLAKVQ